MPLPQPAPRSRTAGRPCATLLRWHWLASLPAMSACTAKALSPTFRLESSPSSSPPPSASSRSDPALLVHDDDSDEDARHHAYHNDNNGDNLANAGANKIMLVDHTAGNPSENSSGLWARSARVVDYIIISGSRTRAGAYVAYNCEIATFEGAQFTVRKRYSEFFLLREQLKATFPNSLGSLPSLPPKSVVSKFRPKFLEQRREGLSYFLSCILLNPEFAGSPLVREFLLRSRSDD